MKKIKKRKILCMMFLLLTLILGTVTTVQASAVRLNKTKLTLIKGETIRLKLSGTKKTPKWSSSKPSVASVSSKGTVTAKKNGTTYIYAKIGKTKYKCVVKVETPRINFTKKTLKVNETATIKLSGTTLKAKYTSSNPKIVRVASNGKIRGLKAGTASITVKVNTRKYTCKVTVVKPAPKPSLSNTSLRMKKGETKKLTVKNYKDLIVWTSSDKTVASVDSNGVVTAIRDGSAVICASGRGMKLNCKIIVTTTVKKQNEPTLVKGTKTAKKEITNSQGKKEVVEVTINTYTYKFSTVPVNLGELKQYNLTVPDGRYKTMALLILAYRTWTPTNPTDCEEMLAYLNNREMTPYYKNFLRDRMKGDQKYKYLGNAYLNGATPENNYTPAKPISITLRQDTLPGKGNSISENIPYFEKTQTTPDIYRAFIDFPGSDSSRWICCYKHSKTGKWFIWDQSWHDLLTAVKQPAGEYQY